MLITCTGLYSDKTARQINPPPLNPTAGTGAADALAQDAPVPGVPPSNSNELYIVYAADPGGSTIASEASPGKHHPFLQ